MAVAVAVAVAITVTAGVPVSFICFGAIICKLLVNAGSRIFVFV